MSRKRVWEIGAGLVLLLVLAITLGGWLYHKSLNDELTRLLKKGDLDRSEIAAVHSLLRRGASIHTKCDDGSNVLMIAAASRDLPLLREALRQGVSVNSRDRIGHTPLLYGIYGRDEACVRMLLAAGSDVEARDYQGRSALMLATEFRFRDGINLLIAYGADINRRNGKGHTALVYTGGHPGLTRLLKQHGATK